MQRMAQLCARSEREDPKSQDLKLAQVVSSNKKVTFSAPLAEEQSDFKLGQVHSLNPVRPSRLV